MIDTCNQSQGLGSKSGVLLVYNSLAHYLGCLFYKEQLTFFSNNLYDMPMKENLTCSLDRCTVYVNSPGSQQCIVTISCDSGWTGLPDVRYDEAGSSGDGGGGGDDDEDGISFLQLFAVSNAFTIVKFNKLISS